MAVHQKRMSTMVTMFSKFQILCGNFWKFGEPGFLNRSVCASLGTKVRLKPL